MARESKGKRGEDFHVYLIYDAFQAPTGRINCEFSFLGLRNARVSC
jgi:hypothetical protein